MRVCVITRVTCNDSSHLSWLKSHAVESESSRVISQVTRVKSSHLGEMSSQVKSSKKLRLESESVTWLVTTLQIWHHICENYIPVCLCLAWEWHGSRSWVRWSGGASAGRWWRRWTQPPGLPPQPPHVSRCLPRSLLDKDDHNDNHTQY